MIRILHIIGSMSCGGAETMIMRLYRHIDRTRIQFDFFTPDVGEVYYGEEIKKLGGKVYISAKRSENLQRYCKDLCCLLKSKKYQIIHIHTSHVSSSLIPAMIAFSAGVKIRIAHSHNTYCAPEWQQKLLRPLTNVFFTKRLSCGQKAGDWMYGKKSFDVFPLPVECEKFKFTRIEREKQRKLLKVENEVVYGHVGRFAYEKNHEFLIHVFFEILKYENAKLLLIGSGNKETEIKELVRCLKIEDKVIFLGIVNDVHKKLCAIDKFLLPSLYEGFPTVILEAQANGLPCYLSDTITKDIALTNLVKFIPLAESAENWAKRIIKGSKRANCEEYNELIAQKYDVKILSKRLQSIYEKELKK